MRCTHCQAVLQETHREHHRASTQTWYECPLCERRSLYSVPRSVTPVWLLPTAQPQHASWPRG